MWQSCHKLPVPVSPKHNLQLQQAIRDAISATKNGGQVTHDSNASAAAFRAHFPKVSKRLDNWENSLACIPEAESDANLQIVCSLAWWLRDPVFIWRVVADWLYPEVSNRARKLLDPVTPFLRLLELPRFDGQVDYAA